MMGMFLKISAESEYLYASVTGEFSLEEAERIFLEILNAAAQHKYKKVLFDGREISGEPTDMQRFYYGAYVARAVVDFTNRSGLPSPKFAYALEEPILDPRRFGENVAANRGMHVKAFDNLEDAMEWLGVGPSNKPDAGGT
jgi:hypothetical protein